jgi:hypothetical protein
MPATRGANSATSNGLKNEEPKNKKAKVTRQKSTVTVEQQHNSSIENEDAQAAPVKNTTKSTSNKKQLEEVQNVVDQTASVTSTRSSRKSESSTTTRGKKDAASKEEVAAKAEEAANSSFQEMEVEEPSSTSSTTANYKSTPTKAKSLANQTINTTNGGNISTITSITHPEDSLMTDISTVTTFTESTVLTNGKNQTQAREVVQIQRRDNPGYALAVGENLSNQLGLGTDIDNRKKPQIIKELPTNVIQIASGGMHSACLTADGIVSSIINFL